MSFLFLILIIFVMKQEILARSEEWIDTIQGECQNYLPAGQSAKFLSVWEQLKVIFNNGEEYDEEFRRRVVKENNLHVAIAKGDVAHLSPTAKEAFLFCEELNGLLPSCLNTEPNLKKLNRAKYHFAARGEQLVFQYERNVNVSMVEAVVRTDVEEVDELVYWSKDKLYVISFVPELDEEHCISTIHTL